MSLPLRTREFLSCESPRWPMLSGLDPRQPQNGGEIAGRGEHAITGGTHVCYGHRERDPRVIHPRARAQAVRRSPKTLIAVAFLMIFIPRVSAMAPTRPDGDGAGAHRELLVQAPPPLPLPSPPSPRPPPPRAPLSPQASDVPGLGSMQLVPSHRRELQTAEACTETCNYASDGVCDDGGLGSEFSDCSRGADCTDCGTRARPPSQPPSPPSPPPSQPNLVSTAAGLTSALANTAIGHIILASGTYNLISELSITRSVILEAAAGATVTLNAQASSSSPRRVLYISPGPSGFVQLIRLSITGGYIINVRAHVQKFPSPRWEFALLTCPFRFSSCMMAAASIYQTGVRAIICLKLQKFPSPRWENG